MTLAHLAPFVHSWTPKGQTHTGVLEILAMKTTAVAVDHESRVSRLERDRSRHERTARRNAEFAWGCNAEIQRSYRERAVAAARLAEIRELVCEQADDDTDYHSTAPVPVLSWTRETETYRTLAWAQPGECGGQPWQADRSSDARATDFGAWKGSARDRVAQVAEIWGGDLAIFKAMVRR